ncbi:hypothetical protein ACEF17_11635, partial [Streptococcus hyovaginalis]
GGGGGRGGGGEKGVRKRGGVVVVKKETDPLLVSGTGEVIEPGEGICAIGAGGNHATAAGRVVKTYAGDNVSAYDIAKAALEIAGEIWVYTNNNIIVEEL